jgi:GT2 family glycosyltransferase
MQRHAPEVLVVAYGAPQLLADALEVLGVGLRVYVVDNSVSDDVRQVADRHGATYIRPERNLGFAAGVNVGLSRVSAGRDVLLLNPDARLSGGAVLCLQEHLDSDVAAVAPRLRRPSGEVERTTWPIPSPLSPWFGVVGLSDRIPRKANFLSGAVLLLNGRALDEVGSFDERYFLYAEETDWQRRALLAGWTLREVPDVEAVHLGGATSNDLELRERLFHGSAELFIRKWHGALGWNVFRLGSLLAAGRRWLLARDAAERHLARLTLRLYVKGPARSIPAAFRRVE